MKVERQNEEEDPSLLRCQLRLLQLPNQDLETERGLEGLEYDPMELVAAVQQVQALRQHPKVVEPAELAAAADSDADAPDVAADVCLP